MIELPVAGVLVVARRLHDGGGRRSTAVPPGPQLAALVKAVGGVAGPSSGTGPADAPAAAVRATPERRGRDGQNPDRETADRGDGCSRSLVLAAVVLLEVAILRDDIATDIDLLLDAGRGESSTSAAPEPDGRPIAPVAPAAAGSVTAVDLRPLARVRPGAPCTVRLEVRLLPGADPQAVTWSYRIVDRCTGAVGSAPGGSVAVPAGGRAGRGRRRRRAAAGARPWRWSPSPTAPRSRPRQPVLVGSCAVRSTGRR